MKHPAYHLRPNKTADRFALLEAIKRLEKLHDGGLRDYTYYGLGGPYLEDFRLLYEVCPEIGMVSIENEPETYKRQEFHLPCKTLQLKQGDITSFIAQYSPNDLRSIFWLDYTGLKYQCFQDFRALLGKITEDSMVKVTLRSEPRDFWIQENGRRNRKKVDDFYNEFAGVLPNPSNPPPRKRQDFATLLQKMLRVAATKAFPPTATDFTFLPVSSFYYKDGTGMFTLTGVVCQNRKKCEVERVFGDWEFANLTWKQPKLIDVPTLSTKERLHLQHLLPSSDATGKALRETLGYLIEDNIPKTEVALKQYAKFHRYSPYLLRGVP